MPAYTETSLIYTRSPLVSYRLALHLEDSLLYDLRLKKSRELAAQSDQVISGRGVALFRNLADASHMRSLQPSQAAIWTWVPGEPSCWLDGPSGTATSIQIII